jgi:hypothetical protein
LQIHSQYTKANPKVKEKEVINLVLRNMDPILKSSIRGHKFSSLTELISMYSVEEAKMKEDKLFYERREH